MNLYMLLSAVVVVGGAVMGVIKWQKVKNGGQIGIAFVQSIAESYGPNDDTPGKITPAEWAKAFKDAGAVGEGILKDM